MFDHICMHACVYILYRESTTLVSMVLTKMVVIWHVVSSPVNYSSCIAIYIAS